VPDQLATVARVGRRADIEKVVDTLGADRAESDRSLGASLRQPPDLGVLQRCLLASLDPVNDSRPGPTTKNLVQDCSWRIASQHVLRKLRTHWIVTLESAPALERIAVPGMSTHILVMKVVAMSEDVEAGADLVGKHNRERVRELLAKF